MKRILSFIAAAALVASMGASAFAAGNVVGVASNNPQKLDTDYNTLSDYTTNGHVGRVPYGKTFYYALKSAGTPCSHLGASAVHNTAECGYKELKTCDNNGYVACTHSDGCGWVNAATDPGVACTYASHPGILACPVTGEGGTFDTCTCGHKVHNADKVDEGCNNNDSATNGKCEYKHQVAVPCPQAGNDVGNDAFECNCTPKHTHDVTVCSYREPLTGVVCSHEKADGTAGFDECPHTAAVDCFKQDAAPCKHVSGNHDATCGYNAYTLVHDNDFVKSASIKQSWEMGKNYVQKVEIVKKKLSSTVPGTVAGEKYYYLLAVTTKPQTTTELNDLYGTITLRKSGTNGFISNSAKDNEIVVDVNVELAYDGAVSGYLVTDYVQTFDFEDGDTEEEIRFAEHDNDYFIVDTCDQDDINLKVTDTFDSELAARAPEANLHFFNGNYATFNRMGTLTLAGCDLGVAKHVYSIDKDGKFAAVKAEYDSYEEAFKIKTRVLGRYVLSDKELDLAKVNASVSNSSSSSTTSKPSTDDGKTNPPTGAIA